LASFLGGQRNQGCSGCCWLFVGWLTQGSFICYGLLGFGAGGVSCHPPRLGSLLAMLLPSLLLLLLLLLLHGGLDFKLGGAIR
jgi:hypothetical protein